MKVTLNIPAEEVQNLIQFLCEVYDYSATIYDPQDLVTVIPNPETKEEFAKRHILRPLKQGFDNWLVRKAVKEANVTSNLTLDKIE